MTLGSVLGTLKDTIMSTNLWGMILPLTKQRGSNGMDNICLYWERHPDKLSVQDDQSLSTNL